MCSETNVLIHSSVKRRERLAHCSFAPLKKNSVLYTAKKNNLIIIIAGPKIKRKKRRKK
jgi:hypothetical protein